MPNAIDSARVTAPMWRCAVTLLMLLAGTAPAWVLAQGPGGFGASPAAPRPAAPERSNRVARGLTEFATEEPVAELRVQGNKTVPASRITGQMQTRVGRPFDPRTLAADIKTLASLPYFVSVRPLTKSTPEGVVIVLEVAERSAIRYVEYLGNESIKNKKLAEETGLAAGGAIDPYAVEEGRRKVEALYRSNGFGRVVVETIEGNKPTDHGVTYVINEGPKQRIWDVEFEGNSFATDGQLKTKIESKPNITRLFGGKLNTDELDADVNRLTSYYRSFGFFKARIGRIVELNDNGDWATIKFVIHEGPRYKIRNVTIFGAEKFANEDLASGLELTEGQDFERAKLQHDTAWLQELYGSRGYIYANIEPETVYLEEPGLVDLVYNIEEGDRWRVGRVRVSINGEASHTRIQTAINRLSLQPGDILDTREIRSSEIRLSRSTIFNTNPGQGAVPKIGYQVSEQTRQRLAERATEKKKRAPNGVFRGQSPVGGAGPKRHTSYKPPAPSVYQAQQAGYPPQQTGSAYPTTGQPAPYPATAYQSAPNPAAGYGGVAVGSTGPGTAPIGSNAAPVQPLGASPAVYQSTAPASQQVTPVQYGAPLPPPTAPQQGYPSYPPPTQEVLPPPAGAYVGGPLPEPIPPVPVNTQIFPTQVYAPTPVPPPNDPMADLVVNLEETQTGRFMVGVAVNSDAGLVGQIMLDERNFDWRRFPRSFQDVRDGTAFRGGGQRFRLEAAPGTQVQRYLASWQEPYLFDTPISLNLSGSYYDRRYDDWDENRLGGRIGLGYQWTDRDLSASLTYRGESINIHDVADSTLPEYAEMEGDNSLHGFGVRVISDKRDNPFLATQGCYFALTLEQVTGSFDYPRAEIEARTYYLLRERPDHTGRHVLTYQTRLGFTGSNTPVYDRFFAGGFSTMRGYDFRGASPLSANGLEVGGDFRWLNTWEYMFPLSADGMVNGVVFTDFGTVTPSVSLDDFRVAPGVGLRLTVPAMGPAPIALDFAWPVAGPDTDDKQVFTFNVGFQR